jgi:hypothetical protein
MNTPTLNPCEECKGTGETIIEKHNCDCPDCLGTGLEQPQKRIMQLEYQLADAKEKATTAWSDNLILDSRNRQLERELAEAKQKEVTLTNTIKNDRYVGRQEGLQMERELAEARDQLVGAGKLMKACDVLVRDLTEAREKLAKAINDYETAVLREHRMQEQRDTLADAMIKYMEHHMRYGHVTTNEIREVEQAIAAVKGGQNG